MPRNRKSARRQRLEAAVVYPLDWLEERSGLIRGGAEIGPDTLARFYSIHMLLLPGAIAGLIGLHLYLVVRLGVTSPPWSKEAAGAERVEPAPKRGRRGLLQPGPRGGIPR